jgi:hypothetical protein
MVQPVLYYPSRTRIDCALRGLGGTCGTDTDNAVIALKPLPADPSTVAVLA